jgi:hypothetical protein
MITYTVSHHSFRPANETVTNTSILGYGTNYVSFLGNFLKWVNVMFYF